MHVPYNYLQEQFRADRPLYYRIMAAIEKVVSVGDFTLGGVVAEFEAAYAATVGYRYGVAVNSGTDALFLSLKALGIGKRHTVVTVPNTFVATVGAIIAAGATPAFADIANDYLMIPYSKREARIRYGWGEFTGTAISDMPSEANPVALPVAWGGYMPRDNGRWQADLVDAAQAVNPLSTPVSGMFRVAAYSLHPLKNVNVWGDGGIVCTDDAVIASQIRLLRNHGLADRNTVVVPGYNSRLDSIQAAIGLEVLKDLATITMRRRQIACEYNLAFEAMDEVTLPDILYPQCHVYHLYQAEFQRRDELLAYLLAHGVEAKVHYPTPLHLQPAFAYLRYKAGDLPNAERFAANHLTLPVHQYLTSVQVDHVIKTVKGFYAHKN